MFITLVMVSSVNGKITAGENTRVHDWSSPEDQKYFAELKAKSRLIIAGRRTYEAARENLKLSPKTLRVVLTANPTVYKNLAVSGQLEFTNDAPKKIIEKLERRGYREALLVGGGEINSMFLQAKLVDEIWLTIEPKIFGAGKNLFAEKELNVDLRLKSAERLNRTGTLLLKYVIGHS